MHEGKGRTAAWDHGFPSHVPPALRTARGFVRTCGETPRPTCKFPWVVVCVDAHCALSKTIVPSVSLWSSYRTPDGVNHLVSQSVRIRGHRYRPPDGVNWEVYLLLIINTSEGPRTKGAHRKWDQRIGHTGGSRHGEPADQHCCAGRVSHTDSEAREVEPKSIKAHVLRTYVDLGMIVSLPPVVPSSLRLPRPCATPSPPAAPAPEPGTGGVITHGHDLLALHHASLGAH